MTRICTYLNFAGQAEEAFAFYKSVFGTEFDGVITRFGDAPPMEGMPELSESDKQLVMNVQMPIAGGHLLLGSDVPDAPDAMGGQGLNMGNNFYICIQTDTRDEADSLFAALAEGGKVEMALADMFWGDYFGSFADKFGIQWMVSCSSNA
ncbi:MAG: VOC family protein [Thermomicrobiales bacterium]